MFVRRLVPLLSIPVVLFAGCGGSSDEGAATTVPLPLRAGAIAGGWTGVLEQKGIAPFRVAVRIEPSGVGQVAYTGIDCAGNWQPRRIVSFQSHFFAFTERITRGAGDKCKGTGLVKAYDDRTTRKQKLHYRFTGGGIRSHGILTRTDASGLAPVFHQAGVKPPN